MTSYARISGPIACDLLHSPLLLDPAQPLPEPECDPVNLPGPCCSMMGLGGGVDRRSRSGIRWDMQPAVACPDPSSLWVGWPGSEQSPSDVLVPFSDCASVHQSSTGSGDLSFSGVVVWVRVGRVRGMKTAGVTAPKVPWRGAVEIEKAKSDKTCSCLGA